MKGVLIFISVIILGEFEEGTIGLKWNMTNLGEVIAVIAVGLRMYQPSKTID